MTETEEQRLTRNVAELLQELRVAQAGVQILFGFLLAVAFTEVYTRADDFQRGVHLVTVLFSVAAVALLTAPAAWHRMLFRQGQRPVILRVANTLAMWGMACLAAAMTGTVLLLTDVALGTGFAVAVAAVTAVGFVTLWFVLPFRARRDNGEGSP
ncbi:hypothetical protein EV193_101781 [Herbihabitans rhizosphaerae]|uniref:Integral membrane protein n=1 Tax=Herbihabitans rhizosphaerae TaxID=1872711 RepID=A0A4Q7L7M7_9PSEU|nr:DUF6328 family protein [Herbihabitans rhizosphaerae]RZS44900.1 hypothetical protein EV193_101781 [Herbihabitans rhizosphaerae]